MSGAFNIDIEVGPVDGGKKIKIYCASLTDTWTVERGQIQIAQFHASLSKEDAILKNKIALGVCPKSDNINGCEQFLSRLGCTAAVLRISRLHDFLAMPNDVREGLTYASHKPFGKTIREGYMQKHPRFVRRGGGRRWIRLTKDERGGSLICYVDENSQTAMSSLKIGSQTQIQNLKDKGIPNAFVLKSGKRQWVLQATSARDYTNWQSQLVVMLKEFGPVNIQPNTAQQKESVTKPSTSSPVRGHERAHTAAQSANAGKLLKENQEMKDNIAKMKIRIREFASEIDRLKDLEIEMKTSEAELRRKGQKKAEREKDDLIATFEVKQDNLRQAIEQLHQKLEQKTADEGGRSGLKSLFGEDYVKIDIDDYKKSSPSKGDMMEDEDDDEEEALTGGGRATNYFEDDEEEGLNGSDDAHIKYLHKHLHYHDHKHIHDHRHTHIHDHTGDKAITYTHTHTIAHTITHTMTQFKIKKNTFGGI